MVELVVIVGCLLEVSFRFEFGGSDECLVVAVVDWCLVVWVCGCCGLCCCLVGLLWMILVRLLLIVLVLRFFMVCTLLFGFYVLVV